MHSSRKKSHKKRGGGGNHEHKEPKQQEENGGGERFENPNFEVRHSDVLGRYVVAKKNVGAGVLVVKVSPIVVGPVQDSNHPCLGCYDPIADIATSYKCEGCKWPLCGAKCPSRNKEYGHSKWECEALARIPEVERPARTEDAIMYDAIVPLRCLLLKRHAPDKWDILTSMESHGDIRRHLPYIWDNNQTKVVDRIREKWGLKEFTEEEIHTVCGYLEVNSFAIGQKGTNLRGLYPMIFLLSHDCVPNTAHVDDDDFNILVRTATPITKGTPLTFTYAFSLQGTLKRRAHIKQSKFFDCMCKRCCDPTELGTMISALKCPCKAGFLLPQNSLEKTSEWVCQLPKCKNTIKAEEVIDILNRVENELDNIKGEDIQQYETFLEKYKETFHPNHYHMIGAKYALSQMYGKIPGNLLQQMSPNLLQRKIDICQSILKIFNIVEPGLSRIRGVTMYELHAPMMLLITSKFQEGIVTNNELKNTLREVVQYLKEAHYILSFENKTSSEGMMGQAAKEALDQTKEWENIIGQF